MGRERLLERFHGVGEDKHDTNLTSNERMVEVKEELVGSTVPNLKKSQLNDRRSNCQLEMNFR